MTEQNTTETQQLSLIENRLSTFDEFEKQISDLREKCNIKIDGVDDKENYSAAKEAKKTVNQVIKNTNEKKRELTSEATEYKKRVTEVADHIKNALTEIKEPLDAEIKRIDEEKAAIRQAQKEAKEREYNDRIAKLLEAGASFNGSTYEVGKFSCSPVQLREVSEAAFKTLLSGASEQAAEIMEAKKAEEKAEQARKEHLEQIEKQQAAERKKIEEERAELAKLRAELEIKKASVIKGQSVGPSVGMHHPITTENKNPHEQEPAKPIDQPKPTRPTTSPEPSANKPSASSSRYEATANAKHDIELCSNQLIELIKNNSDVIKSMDFKTDKYLKIRNKIHETHLKMIEWIKNNE